MRRLALPALLMVSSLAWAQLISAPMPDLQRGLAAIEKGDIAAAETDLVPLANMGYQQARLALARYYAERPDPESFEKAMQWYGLAVAADKTLRVPMAQLLIKKGDPESVAEGEEMLVQAYKRRDPRALRALVRLYAEFPQNYDEEIAGTFAARAAKSDDREDKAAAIGWYRAHADKEQYAELLYKQCSKAKSWLPECYADLARDARVTGDTEALDGLVAEAKAAAQKGNMPVDVVERVSRVLTAEDLPGAARPAVAYELLREIAKSSPWAKARMGRLLLGQPELDPDTNPEPLLAEAAAQGSPEAKLDLGRMYIEDKLKPAEPEKALTFLTEASAVLPAAHFHLGRFYERGYLGRPEPQRALQHYLKAARGGYARADMALAQMYSNNRGVRVNEENAYAFALLAVQHEVLGSTELLNQIRQGMTAQEVTRSMRVAETEFSARKAAAAVAAATPATNVAVQENKQ